MSYLCGLSANFPLCMYWYYHIQKHLVVQYLYAFVTDSLSEEKNNKMLTR